jgi:hypothetical protein
LIGRIKKTKRASHSSCRLAKRMDALVRWVAHQPLPDLRWPDALM